MSGVAAALALTIGRNYKLQLFFVGFQTVTQCKQNQTRATEMESLIIYRTLQNGTPFSMFSMLCFPTEHNLLIS